MHGYLQGNHLPVQMGARRTISHSTVPYSSKERPKNFERNRHSVILLSELPKDVNTRFGLRLRELRRSRNMTQLRMSVDFGIDRSFISDVERGRKSISLHMLEILALGLNVSLSDLFDGI